MAVSFYYTFGKEEKHHYTTDEGKFTSSDEIRCSRGGEDGHVVVLGRDAV
jgi:hypothetical protein